MNKLVRNKNLAFLLSLGCFDLAVARSLSCGFFDLGDNPAREASRKHAGNFLSHEIWKATDSRVARYKEIEGLPAEVHDQKSLDDYASKTLSSRNSVEGERVLSPGKNGENKAGQKIYRFIESEEGARQFAEALVAKGVAPGEVYKKPIDQKIPLFKVGKAYEDIRQSVLIKCSAPTIRGSILRQQISAINL